MTRHLLAFLVIGMAASGAAAQTKAESLFDHLSWDVGAVPRTTTFHHCFEVTNTTDKPIRIGPIRVSCGCVSGHAAKNELAPGEHTTVFAQIETRQFTGLITKTIFVGIDQGGFDEVRIHVQATILPEMSVSPGALTFGKTKKGKAMESSLVVSYPADRLGAIEKATSESTFVKVKAEPLAENAGMRSYRVTAKVGPDLPAGNWQCTIWLAGAQASQPAINIPLTVEVIP